MAENHISEITRELSVSPSRIQLDDDVALTTRFQPLRRSAPRLIDRLGDLNAANERLIGFGPIRQLRIRMGVRAHFLHAMEPPATAKPERACETKYPRRRDHSHALSEELRRG